MLRIARIITPLIATVGVLLGVAIAAPAAASDHFPPQRWETPRTVCIHSTMGSGWTSPRRAVERLDSAVWYWDLKFRPSTSSCAGHDQVITIHRVNDPNKGRAWNTRTTVWKTGTDGRQFAALNTVNVYMNTNSKFSRTHEQNVRTFMHELMHGMVTPRGSDWTGGHTSRCDSLLSGSFSCAQSHSKPTSYDLNAIKSVYWPAWQPTFSF